MRLLALSTCPRCDRVEGVRSIVAAAVVASAVYAFDTGAWRVFAWTLGAYCLNVAISIGWHAQHTGDWR
jgi:hypothetical protein